jgi:phage terminase small subunit
VSRASNSKGKPKPSNVELTDKQQAFCREYLVDLNATQAAIRAGYSEKTAKSIGQENLTKPDIQAEVQRLMKARADRVEVTADTVLRELLQIATVDLAEAFDENGRLKPLHEIPLSVRKAIAGVEVYEEFAGRGEDREQIGETKKVRFWDKNKALEMLGRHLRLFADRLEHSGPDGSPISVESPRSKEDMAAFAQMLAEARKKIG